MQSSIPFVILADHFLSRWGQATLSVRRDVTLEERLRTLPHRQKHLLRSTRRRPLTARTVLS
jgi:hypothetical protein